MILANSNPATIMADPDLADATYIEPVTQLDPVVGATPTQQDPAVVCRR